MRFEDVRKGDRIRYEYVDPTSGRRTLIEDVAFHLGRTGEAWTAAGGKTVCSNRAGATITLLGAYGALERKHCNPALAGETVATAERREKLGWPWPVSGDDTARNKR